MLPPTNIPFFCTKIYTKNKHLFSFFRKCFVIFFIINLLDGSNLFFTGSLSFYKKIVPLFLNFFLTYSIFFHIIRIFTEGSSNGRTTGSGPVSQGSNPCPSANQILYQIFFICNVFLSNPCIHHFLPF